MDRHWRTPLVPVFLFLEELGNVSRACKVFGYSRDSFYRFKNLYETSDEQALQEIDKTRPNLKKRVSEEVEAAAYAMAVEQSTFGQMRVSNYLKRKADRGTEFCGNRENNEYQLYLAVQTLITQRPE